MTYDPRAATGIPTEPVGSLPRPSKLQAAYAAYDAGEISKADLEAEQEEAVRDSIARMEATGSPIVSDGEQRWSSFATYPITDTLAGTGLADHLGGGGQYFAIFADGHNRQLPRLTGGPFRYKSFAADSLKLSIKSATKPMKQAVIAPSMLALLYPLDEAIEGYSREAFEADLIDECEKDVRAAFAAGAVRVSIDFTEGRLSCRNDSRNPWTGREMLPHFIELINSVLDRFTAEERVNIGIHTCPGGDCDSVHSADVPYNRPAAEHVPAECRLLHDPVQERAEPGAGLQGHRGEHPHRRQRRHADGLHRRRSTRRTRGSNRPRRCASSSSRPPITCRRSRSPRPTTVASRPSALT